jgi:hypothetical protein
VVAPKRVAIVYAERDCILTEPEEDTKREGTNPEKWKLNPKFLEQTIILGGTISGKLWGLLSTQR